MGDTPNRRPADQSTPDTAGADLPRPIIGFLVGLLVGMTVLALVWITVSSMGGGSVTVTGSDDAATVQPGGVASQEEQPDEPAGPTALQLCRRADAEVKEGLHAAGPALGQWEVHVGAMNKLVVGAITLGQATTFWNQTRIAARRHLETFQEAARQATSHMGTCHRPVAAMSPGASGALRSCTRRVAADREALQAARTAITTWGHHVMDMEMLRTGHLSPARATQMWLASWREGVRQIRAFHEAARVAQDSGSC
jgi:hypothetical protein